MCGKFPIKEDFNASAINFFKPNRERIENMISTIQKMEKSLDKYLDKPFEDNNAHFACGDALENVMEELKRLIIAMNYYQTDIIAKANSWDRYPYDFFNGEDRNELERRAYVKGYFDSEKSRTD